MAEASAPVLVVGGGASGMALALALHANGVASTIVDARPRGAARRDARVLALSEGSRLLLEQLGAWRALPATPIETIDISQQDGHGHTVLRARDEALPALGHVVAASDLCAALDEALTAAGVPVLDQTRVDHVQPGTEHITVRCRGSQGEHDISARLVAHAEGTGTDGEDAFHTRHYGQHAVVTVAHTEEPHGGVAWERFTPDGPLALLPHGKAWAVVCTTPAERSAALQEMPAADFVALLQQRFGPRLTFTGVEARAAFPLGLKLRRQLVAARQVWVGNAAQTLHPVAGQGFNLGLRDAWELARSLRDMPDPGAAHLLARYARDRQADRWGASAFTDVLIQLFSNRSPVLNTIRGAGLTLLDLLPPARRFVTRRMIWGARAWP